jgi:hypothetical protein
MNEAGQPSIVLSNPLDQFTNAAIVTKDKILKCFRIQAGELSNEIDEQPDIDLKEELIAQDDLQGIKWKSDNY